MNKWLSKIKASVVGARQSPDAASVQVIGPEEHGIPRELICRHAISVIERLLAAGFEAYLVGGSVRDLLVSQRPKDFDVVTNATPEQVCPLFKNARLIGRRFHLVHVCFGRQVIEVATYRKAAKRPILRGKIKHHAHLKKDNVYGTQTQDAVRRDFNVNALYYDIRDHSIIDYAGGVLALQQSTFAMIGEPEARYREDPIRLLRALRLMAKLGLQPADATAEPIAALAPLLASVPSARLFEEIKKSFFHGYAEAMFGLIERYGILPTCFADLDQHLPDPPSQALIDQALVNTDLRFHQGQSLNPAFLLSVFLWPMLQKHIDSALRQGCKPYMAKQNAMSEVLKQQTKVMAISRRLTVMMKEIWSFQHLLEQRRPRQIRYVILQKRFRAAYDFLCLRASIDPALQPLADWWTSYQMQDAKEQEAMVSALHTGKSQRDKV